MSNSLGIGVGFSTYVVSYLNTGESLGSGVLGGTTGIMIGSMPLFWAARAIYVPSFAFGIIAGSYFREKYLDD